MGIHTLESVNEDKEFFYTTSLKLFFGLWPLCLYVGEPFYLRMIDKMYTSESAYHVLEA